MMFKMPCPKCGFGVEFLDAQSGYTIYCPRCNKPIFLRIPNFTYVKLLMWTGIIIAALVGMFFLLSALNPEIKATGQSMWKGIVRMFNPTGAPRR